MISAMAAIVYGVLAIVGGVIGYRQANSQMSLISGTVSGLLLIGGGIARSQGLAWGTSLSAIVTLVLIGVFAGRYWKTRKPMPAAMMIAVGIVVLLLMALPIG